jgi:NAD(P)-dependent dehydrogenase (short-subunit alcohol dehydrogenase family)
MNPKIRSWRGKRVWIIGASSGIGAATASLLLEAGALVAVSARRRDALQQAVGAHPSAALLPLDITHHASIIAARDTLLGRWQEIDLVLVVAGSYAEMRAEDFDLAKANALIDLNLRGVLNCLDAALPFLLAQGAGGFGMVGSVAGYSGLPKALAYGPTKAAVINLAESLYIDLRSRGISVYLINPGFVDTPLTAGNRFPMPALISADEAARELVKGMMQGQFHIHFPRRFTNVLRFARLLPYRAYFWLIHRLTGL